MWSQAQLAVFFCVLFPSLFTSYVRFEDQDVTAEIANRSFHLVEAVFNSLIWRRQTLTNGSDSVDHAADHPKALGKATQLHILVTQSFAPEALQQDPDGLLCL